MGSFYFLWARYVSNQASCIATVLNTSVPIAHYQTSPATSLTYLTSQHLYLGSRLGESQLIRIHTSPVAKLDEETVSVPKGITTVLPSSLSASGKGKEKASDGGGGSELPSSEKEGVLVLGKGSYLEIVERFENVGPVWDAASADLDGSGQVGLVLESLKPLSLDDHPIFLFSVNCAS